MPVPSLPSDPESNCKMSSNDVVRIAIQNTVGSKSGSGGGIGINHLMQLAKNSELSAVVKELCGIWKLDRPEDYALKFETTKEFVTEKNKEDIKNGSILKFCQSPRKIVHELLHKLTSNTDPQNRLICLRALESQSADYAVGQELVRSSGLEILIKTVSEGSASAQVVSLVILTFHEVMKQEDLLSWEDDIISPEFIGQVAANIDTEKTMLALKQDEKTHQCCLAVLEALVNTPSKYEVTEQTISFSSLLNFIQNDNPMVQQHALALFNALFRLGDKHKKRKMKQIMEERQTRRIIVEYIIRKNPNEEMRHQLYVLQTLLLNLLEERMYTMVESQGPKALEKIKELRKIAFESRSDSAPVQKRFAEEYKRLGFTNDVDPTQDFKEAPPGMLALDMMYAFACNHSDQYTKLVLESSCRGDQHDCPFARSSIEIVKLICQIIRIGHEPLSSGSRGGRFYPMFFTHENPLEEMFALVIQHVHRTWREMRATTEDFKKVMEVAQEQITSSLKLSPLTMEEFKKGLKTYNEISESRKEEAKNRGEREGKAIQHLRSLITPEIVELIQRQRLNFLVAGTKFHKFKKEGKGKFLLVKLSPNHKAFHYGDWNDDSGGNAMPPSLDMALSHKLPLAEINDIQTGSNAHFVKDSNRRNRDRVADNLAISILRENGDTLDVIAPSQKAFDYWCDGMNALMRKEMRSEEATKDLEMLLGMEEKIRLLPLEGIDILDEQPPIPPPPPHFNFCQETH